MPTWVNTSENCTEGLPKTRTFLRDRRIDLAAGCKPAVFLGPDTVRSEWARPGQRNSEVGAP